MNAKDQAKRAAEFLDAERQQIREAKAKLTDNPCLLTIGIFNPDDPFAPPSRCKGVYDGTDPGDLEELAAVLRHINEKAKSNKQITCRAGAFSIWDDPEFPEADE